MAFDAAQGTYVPDAAPAPEQAAPPPDAPVMQPAGPAPQSSFDPNKGEYTGKAEPLPPQAAPAPTGKPPHEWAFMKGFVGQSNRLLTLLKLAATKPALGAGAAGAGESGVDMPPDEEMQDAWFKNVVDPSVEDQARYELPPDASFSDKAFHGLGSTAGMISQAIATGGGAAGEVAAAAGGGRLALAAGGATAMQLPAVNNAIEVGRQVLQETGDKHAAMTAGVTSYLINSASGAVPMGVGGRLATRLATASATGVGMQEAGRVAQNAAMPANMQTPFDPEEDALAAVTSAPFGAMGHAVPHRVAEGAPASAMEAAQRHAAEAVAAQGGDHLDQTVAATQVNAEVGAHHDAAAVHGAREAETQSHADNAEQAARDAAFEQADAEQGKTPVQQAVSKEQAFQQATGDEAAAKDQDFTAARNQQGDQAVEASKTEDIGAEKGGANEPKPTLAEALPPEQLAALQSLKERRAAEAAKPQPTPEPTVQERMKAQAKGTEDDFQELPPVTPKKPGEALFPDAPVSPHMAPEKAPEPPEEEEEPGQGPPPATAQTLAQRRQMALDEARARKVRGEPPPQEAQAPTSPEGPAEVTAPVVEAPEAPPNRLAAIRAAAEKRQASSSPSEEKRPPLRQNYDPAEQMLQDQVAKDADLARTQTKRPPLVQGGDPAEALHEEQVRRDVAATQTAAPEAASAAPQGALAARRLRAIDTSERPIPPREEKQFVARDPDTGDKVKTFGSFEDALEHKKANPGHDITSEPVEQPAATFAERRASSIADMQRSVQEDMKRILNPAMSHDEAKGHLSDMSDHAAPRTLQIHENEHADTVPPELKKQIDAHYMNGGSQVKGAYLNGSMHVFADAHTAGDGDGIRSTAVHEMAHMGMEGLLGDQHVPTMLSIAKDIRNSAWAKDYAARRNMDLSNPKTLALLGDEYAAHLAENITAGRDVHDGLPVPERAVGHWQKIVDAVRSMLRKVGIVRHWNDNDIAALVRQAQAYTGADPLRSARDGAAYKEAAGARFSLDNADDHMEKYFPPDHPNAIGHKLARTGEEQGKYNPGWLRGVKETVRDLGEGVKPDHILGAIGLRNIPDFIREGKMPSVRGFVEDHDAMEGRRRQILNPSIDLAKEWSKWQAGQADRGEHLSDMMHTATLAGHDPSRPYVERHTAAERAASPDAAADEKYHRAFHSSLEKQFNDLDPQARSIFKRVRDTYDDHRTAVMKGIEDRIQSSGADEQTKKNAMSSLRKAFEAGKVKGAYFPLQRFGDLWANAKDSAGNTLSFTRFESRTRRKEWMGEMRRLGHTVDSGERMDAKSEMERISPEFVKNVMGHIEAADPTGRLAKDVWQEYLKAMPEMSMRKHAILRQGRLGFTGDALRSFAYNQFHGAHQLARLEYGNKLDTRMENIKTEARNVEAAGAANPEDKTAQSDAKWAPAIAREMAQRYDWLRNPRSSKLASGLTRLGFSWYLGAAPATAFRIFTQNPMLAHPILAARYGGKGAVGVLRGQTQASKQLIKASMEWAGSRGSLGDRLRGNERKAFDDADRYGLFSDTNTQSMAAGGDGSPMFKGAWHQFQKYAGFMFNAMEHHNRMTTFLAAYRMGVENGLPHDAASQQARAATWDAHFDYTNANRPRYLQGNIPKVIGLFKQYSLGVTYRLAREGANLISAEKTPEERVAAAHALSGLIGRMMLFAGVTGVPGYWIAEKAVNAWMGDEDKPYDMTASLHKHLSDTMGQTAADSIMTGPVGAISGASLSSGASYNDLWYKTPMRDENPKEEMYDALGQLMGPIAAMPINAAVGLGQIHQGNVERGIEHFLPPEAAALAKAFRYGTQGATNQAGQNILPPGEEITNRDVALQSVGFTPQKVADAYRRNAAIKNVEQAVQDRRKLLSDKYETALLAGDQKTAEEVWPQIQKFNETNPGVAIGKSLISGVLNKAKRNATSTQGLNLPPGLSNLEEEY